jgi:hypothetical protein
MPSGLFASPFAHPRPSECNVTGTIGENEIIPWKPHRNAAWRSLTGNRVPLRGFEKE